MHLQAREDLFGHLKSERVAAFVHHITQQLQERVVACGGRAGGGTQCTQWRTASRSKHLQRHARHHRTGILYTSLDLHDANITKHVAPKHTTLSRSVLTSATASFMTAGLPTTQADTCCMASGLHTAVPALGVVAATGRAGGMRGEKRAGG